jgi:Domain of unknown function (DUF6438)
MRPTGTLIFLWAAPGWVWQAKPAKPVNTTITLERTMCFGTCPVYNLTIHGDGSVTYQGQAFVRVKGTVETKIERSKVEKLVRKFEEIGYFELKEKYTTIRNPDGTKYSFTDLPTTITSITIGDKYKRVGDYLGAPPRLRELEKEIDETAGSDRWVIELVP